LSRICIVGTGYVGLVTGACFADLGNDVVCLDIDQEKVDSLNDGGIPIFEPGLEDLVIRNQAANRLTFTTSYADGVPGADFVFIAVDTPPGPAGEANLSSVESAAGMIAGELEGRTIVVDKSTVPVGTGDLVAELIARHRGDEIEFHVVSNPEFLREGSAVSDFLNPDRIVLGSAVREPAEEVATLYRAFDCPIIITDLRTAEMIKYASNAFLATRISFINEIASVCDQLGADVTEVARGMGLDDRIGVGFLNAGIGWGGSCFRKDVLALEHMAAVNGCHPQLLRAVVEINRDMRRSVVRRLREELGELRGKTIAVLGLSFKPNTDDVRDAPAIEIIRLLVNEGAEVRGFDPVATARAAEELPDIHYATDVYEAMTGADAVVLATEWNEFREIDWERAGKLMGNRLMIDGRNVYQGDELRAHGFIYQGVGRGTPQRREPNPALAAEGV
jgi:UDPglucose 6-dehydrogenase